MVREPATKHTPRSRGGANAAVLVAVAVLFIAAFASGTASGSGIFGPSHFTTSPLTFEKGDNTESLKFGTPVSSAAAATSRARNHLDRIEAFHFVGNIGWALATLGEQGNGYEYPLYSTNHGKTWATDGPYFHGPWADAPAWVGDIRAYTQSFAIAYTPGGQTLYVTDDGGHHWYSTFALSYIVSITHVRDQSNNSSTGIVQVGVSETGNAPAAYVFTSSDGGRNWVRRSA